MDSVTAPRRGVQIHATRLCNLRCAHCYSSSAPEERGHLSVALLRDALCDAAAEGYRLAGFSGGEPVLYPWLRELLTHAHQCGMRTTVTSNGMLLDARHLEMLRGGADLLAISLDGVPASHNKMRGSPRAFDHMVSRLDGVRGSGIPFGFIFTLTQHNLDELDWVAHFAVAQGATLLQIHPLEEVGRAVDMLAGCRPDDFEAAVAYLETARLQHELGARITIKIDLMERELLRSRSGLVCPEIAPADAPAMPLSALASPLVIEADGTVSPIGYGFARRYVLGNLHANRLRDLADSWRRHTYPEFNRLCRGVLDEVTGPRDFPFLNWYEILAAYAEQGTAVPAGA